MSGERRDVVVAFLSAFWSRILPFPAVLHADPGAGERLMVVLRTQHEQARYRNVTTTSCPTSSLVFGLFAVYATVDAALRPICD